MKNWLKKTWNWLLGKTTIDEKIVEVSKETKRRVNRVKEELGDVKAAFENTADQIADVVDAAKGSSRKGRKSTPKKKATPRSGAKSSGSGAGNGKSTSRGGAKSSGSGAGKKKAAPKRGNGAKSSGSGAGKGKATRNKK